MSQWVAVARAAEIATGQKKALTANEEPIVVCNVDGNFYAFQDMCSHEELPLSDGEFCGNTIECPFHGSKFDVTTGAVLNLPAVTKIVTYPVKVEGDVIYVEVL